MLTGYDYSTVLSVFYVSYIIFEIPSNLACKYFGPGWFIPIVSLGFGITSIGTAFCQDLSSICGVRFLLGVFEAGTLYFLLLFARLRTVQVGGRRGEGRGKGSRVGSGAEPCRTCFLRTTEARKLIGLIRYVARNRLLHVSMVSTF